MADAQVAAVLRALAELAPGDRTADDVVDVASGDHPFVWLGLHTDPTQLFSSPAPLGWAGGVAPPLPVVPRSSGARRLQGLDALHREEVLLRLGWLFLCGRAELDGRPRRVCMPLVYRPVTMRSQPLVGSVLEGRGEPFTLG